MSSLLRGATIAFQNFERALWNILYRNFPPPEPILISVSKEDVPRKPFSLKDILGDGFLYAVPKFRRSVERRMKRKFGSPDYVWKMIVPKTNLKTCFTCGHPHEVGKLCGHCYDKIREETTLMQEKIQEELKLSPVENEVVVLYDGEKLEEPEEFWKGKRVVEMQKPRPQWFSKNLLQKTTQQPATSTDVKPTELA